MKTKHTYDSKIDNLWKKRTSHRLPKKMPQQTQNRPNMQQVMLQNHTTTQRGRHQNCKQTTDDATIRLYRASRCLKTRLNTTNNQPHNADQIKHTPNRKILETIAYINERKTETEMDSEAIEAI